MNAYSYLWRMHTAVYCSLFFSAHTAILKLTSYVASYQLWCCMRQNNLISARGRLSNFSKHQSNFSPNCNFSVLHSTITTYDSSIDSSFIRGEYLLPAILLVSRCQTAFSPFFPPPQRKTGKSGLATRDYNIIR